MSQSDQFQTMFNLLSGLQLRAGAHVSRGGQPMHRNIQPRPFPMGEGLKLVKPDQLLSIRVPQVRIRYGKIEGYQRPFDARRARAIARWIEQNKNEYLKTLPAIEISIDDGIAWATEGQHRMGGAIIAGVPLKAVVTKRNFDQARRLFALQGKQQRLPRNLLIFDADGPFEEYIQDAVTSDSHPWSQLISASVTGSGSKTRMSATAAFTMLRVFIAGKNQPAGRDVGENIDVSEFDRSGADLLSRLVMPFGNRVSNPLAYSAVGLRAIALTARAVFRNREPLAGDEARWIKMMPAFPFHDFVFLKSSTDLSDQMIRYWNRRAKENQKAARLD